VVGGNRQMKMMKLGWMLLRIWNHKNSVRTPYSATREARLRDRGFPIIEVAPRIDVLTQVFCVRTFSMGRKKWWKSNDGDAW